MTKRITALLLSAALTVALSGNTATAEAAPDTAALIATETRAVSTTDGALEFSDLRERMLQRYYPLLTLSENIQTLEEWDYQRTEDELRRQLNQIADRQWQTVSALSIDPSALIGSGMDASALAGFTAGAGAAGAMVSPVVRAQLQAQYDAYDKAFDNVRKGKLQADNEGVKRQLRDAQNQTVMMAESLYITCDNLAAQETALARSIAALERTEKEMALRYQLGQVSALSVQQVSVGLAQARSGRETLRMNRENLLLQLKAMTGTALDAPLTLAALPQVTQESLDKMDLEADLATAREASYELYSAQKAYDDAKEAYDDARSEYGSSSLKNEWMQAKHTWQAAQYTYENAKQSYELKFRALYARVRDAAQALTAKRAAATAQEKRCAAEALKYEQGTISANALADARDALAQANDEAEIAARDLFTQYRSYENAVTYGILNS